MRWAGVKYYDKLKIVKSFYFFDELLLVIILKVINSVSQI